MHGKILIIEDEEGVRNSPISDKRRFDELSGIEHEFRFKFICLELRTRLVYPPITSIVASYALVEKVIDDFLG